MAQNLYDDPAFFAAYARLERSVEGLAGAAEWPRLRALLPPLSGRRVVDLGCGYGWFCRFAREQGAAAVLGVDLSERMLARAAELTTDPAVTYLREDLDRLVLPARSFDLAFSSLALHYLEHVDHLLATVAGALAPGGHLVFSVEHPIYTAPRRPGWLAGEDGRRRWPIDGYFDEGPRETDWLVKGVVKQHRALATWLDALARHGLALRRLEEFGPSAAQLAAHPDWAAERERPMFLLVAAERGGAP
jgi:SAM-dependent methyltransferase